ncbi:MAG: hypothetical protein CVU56_11575 [Deltaproteobacteria bacterium HGW-Deltaproteobacteria-14]|jgi:hemerythrin superfamily protein|nr:MAG: hypothetical protein CVU56_11575 [Deltaproteobacteria bacterium HGW-Deltaproteobacteria-14]
MTTTRDRFTADHRALEAQLEALDNAVEGANFPTIQAAWAPFERALLEHLEVEEAEALPGFVAAHPEAGEAIRADHAAIRRWLAELGVAGDLHTLRKDRHDDFLALLREHREREEATFYPWVDEAPEGLARRLLAALRQRRGGGA